MSLPAYDLWPLRKRVEGYYVSPRRRQEVKDRDRREDGTIRCFYCTSPTEEVAIHAAVDVRRVFTIDHVLSRERGGTAALGNLRSACLSCNSSKRGRTWPYPHILEANRP